MKLEETVELNIDVEISTLVWALKNLDHDVLFEVFKQVDNMVAEYEFTERLANHFQSVIDKENEHE